MNGCAKLLATCAIALIATACMLGCGGSSGDAAIALIAGHAVTSQMVAHWMAVETASEGPVVSAKPALRRWALGLLILWRWALGEAHEVGVRVGEQEAEKQLTLSRTSRAQGIDYEWFPHERGLVRFLTAPKVTELDQLWLVKLGMLASRIEQRRVAVTRAAIPPARVLAYYRQHRGQFFVGERRDIKAIMNKNRSQVIEAKRELQAGRAFASVEEQFNQSIEGGLRLGRARGRGEKRYEKDYFAAPPHVLVGPFHEILYYIFEVAHIRPGYQRTLAEVEPKIRQRLATQDVDSTFQTIYEQKWRARTRCRTGYTAPGCGRYEAVIAG